MLCIPTDEALCLQTKHSAEVHKLNRWRSQCCHADSKYPGKTDQDRPWLSRMASWSIMVVLLIRWISQMGCHVGKQVDSLRYTLWLMWSALTVLYNHKPSGIHVHIHVYCFNFWRVTLLYLLDYGEGRLEIENLSKKYYIQEINEKKMEVIEGRESENH